MLHETAVAWIRKRLQVSLPKKPWEETEEHFAERLRDAASYINKNFDVEGPSKEFLVRIKK